MLQRSSCRESKLRRTIKNDLHLISRKIFRAFRRWQQIWCQTFSSRTSTMQWKNVMRNCWELTFIGVTVTTFIFRQLMPFRFCGKKAASLLFIAPSSSLAMSPDGGNSPHMDRLQNSFRVNKTSHRCTSCRTAYKINLLRAWPCLMVPGGSVYSNKTPVFFYLSCFQTTVNCFSLL